MERGQGQAGEGARPPRVSTCVYGSCSLLKWLCPGDKSVKAQSPSIPRSFNPGAKKDRNQQAHFLDGESRGPER